MGRGKLLSMLQGGSLGDSTGKSAEPSTSSDEQRRLQSIGDTKRPEISKHQLSVLCQQKCEL